ncbi:MAG: MotA/TolQ/ExbB proton channel family protein, partial [Planctomycetota bacterium]|nr:MotA/TolQ/ExbB proton channel family protein [Planctomycetota bacterium]
MDLATVIGMLAGFGLITVSILSGGGAGMFFNIPGVMIVVGGMVSATLIHFSVGRVLKIFALAKKTLFNQLCPEQEVVQRMVDYAAISRRDGALALEQQIADTSDPFLIKGLQMLIDGQDEDTIHQQLSIEVQYLQERHEDGKKILGFMGASAPAFGMIGTLIGLVQML